MNISGFATKVATGMLKAGVVGAVSLFAGGGFDKIIGLITAKGAATPEIPVDTAVPVDTETMTEAMTMEAPTEVEIPVEPKIEVEA